MMSLGTLGGPDSTACGINDAGQVSGSAQDSAGISHAFLYSNGKMTDLGGLGGGSWAYRINSAGQVAGQAPRPRRGYHVVLNVGTALKVWAPSAALVRSLTASITRGKWRAERVPPAMPPFMPLFTPTAWG